jgi:hypothetical protein
MPLGTDTIHVRFDTTSDLFRLRMGRDSLTFDLGRFARAMSGDPYAGRSDVPADRMRIDEATTRLRAALALRSLSGTRTGNTLQIDRWEGTLFVGRIK